MIKIMHVNTAEPLLYKNQQLLEKEKYQPPKRDKGKQLTKFDVFNQKYSNLDKYLDSFTNDDFIFYFCRLAKDSGFKYIVSNWIKDSKIFSNLLTDFTKKEIITMIDYIFRSGQSYIKNPSINVFASGWINKIYPDSKQWVNPVSDWKDESTKIGW